MKKIFINKENISVLAASTSSNILEKVNIMMLTKHTTEKKKIFKDTNANTNNFSENEVFVEKIWNQPGFLKKLEAILEWKKLTFQETIPSITIYLTGQERCGLFYTPEDNSYRKCTSRC